MKKPFSNLPDLRWEEKTYIMGIINITPDSFSGDGMLTDAGAVQLAREQAEEFLRGGAHILDFGAESSRPGSEKISAEDELQRILPVIKEISSTIDSAYFSIDTYKAKTARACLKAGAHWVNDVWGLRVDPELAHVIADYDAVVVLMHNRSRPDKVLKFGNLGSSYAGTDYVNLIQDIIDELKQSVDIALKAGIDEDHIIIDPGIGFGKTVPQNLELINHLGDFKAIGFPILIGPSRKSFIGKTLDLPVEEREEGTAASIAISIARGADIIRVHNVKKMARVSAMADAIVRH